MDLSKYRHLYVSETQENLDNLGRLLVELEASPGHRAHIDTVFRLLHSIKGMSGTMGYPPICNLAHRLEDLMAQVRSNRVSLDAPAIDALLAGVDRMGQWVAEVEADQALSAAPTDAALLDRVGQLLAAPVDVRSTPDLAPLNTGRPRNASAFPGVQPPPLLLTPMNPGELLVEVTARPECPDPGARGFLLLRKLAPLGTVVDAAPAESELRAGRLLGPLRLNFVTPHAAEHIEAYIRLMPDWALVSVVDRDASQVSLPPDEFGQETDSLVAGDPDLLGALDGLDFDFMDSTEIVQTPSPVLPQPWTSAVTSTPSPLSQGPPSLPAFDQTGPPRAGSTPVPPMQAAPRSATQAPFDRAHAPAAPTPPPGAGQRRREFDDEVERATVPLPPLVLLDASLEASLDSGLGAGDSMEGVDPAAAAAMRARRVAARTIRVRTTWLDGLLDRIHDLQLVSQRLHVLNPPVARSPMGEAVGELGRLLDEVHAEALSARMSAFSTLAQRLPRVVRDLARQAGKRATMLVRGGDELLDRAIIEGLDGPITHLLRNAIDHGIERPEARAAANKPVTGVLTLSCLRVRDEIIVELADDGRGIDRAAVAARAVELGMAEPSVAAHDAEHDLGRLLAMPGLTTRRTAGVLAGRGVGLDAVQAELAALGGTLAVTTRPGQGSVFRLHLPRTPGITRLLMVEADGQLYGLPQARVVRTAWFDAAAVERLENGTLMVHEDEPHRLLSLRTLLDLPEAPLPQQFRGVVLRDPRGPLVVAVDRVEGQQEAVVKPLGPLLEQFEGLTGVTVGANNQPVFVLDIAKLAGVPTT